MSNSDTETSFTDPAVMSIAPPRPGFPACPGLPGPPAPPAWPGCPADDPLPGVPGAPGIPAVPGAPERPAAPFELPPVNSSPVSDSVPPLTEKSRVEPPPDSTTAKPPEPIERFLPDGTVTGWGRVSVQLVAKTTLPLCATAASKLASEQLTGVSGAAMTGSAFISPNDPASAAAPPRQARSRRAGTLPRARRAVPECWSRHPEPTGVSRQVTVLDCQRLPRRFIRFPSRPQHATRSVGDGFRSYARRILRDTGTGLSAGGSPHLGPGPQPTESAGRHPSRSKRLVSCVQLH